MNMYTDDKLCAMSAYVALLLSLDTNQKWVTFMKHVCVDVDDSAEEHYQYWCVVLYIDMIHR